MLLNPRWFQILFQLAFLAFGLVILKWQPDWLHYFISISGCLLFNWLASSFTRRKFLKWKDFSAWGFSVLISAASLCLLLKTNSWPVSLLAAFLTVISKFLFKTNGKHLFNPSAFGIVACILISGNAWLSPSQWGSSTVIFFLVMTLGTIVVTRVQKLDTSLAFLLTYLGLVFYRQVIFLGWPLDHYIHTAFTGSLLLFSFFMITDPRTTPDHSAARIIYAAIIATVSFYYTAFLWKNNTAIYALVFLSPLVPLLDKIFKSQAFTWQNRPLRFPFFKSIFMRTTIKRSAALVLLMTMGIQQAAAFCGFYVSKADGTLKNRTSQVILVRDGNKNVITMYNDFQGDLKDFAMVVPVPAVLKKSDIKVVNQNIFNVLNDYSKPRLVEYYDQNPCNSYSFDVKMEKSDDMSMNEVVVTGYGKTKQRGVKVEAQYIVGEYDILILSAKESSGLKQWLTENNYKIPEGAEEVLEPYIKSKLKFFVVKVNEAEKKKLPGNFLRPIQISYSSPRFMLPIRLGMANADGDQDMIVYAFTKKGRIETTNYPMVPLPTSKNIPLFVKSDFGSFYSNLFQHQWQKNGKAVSMLEYAWDVSPKNFVKCDPCVSNPPSPYDLVQAGVWWINRNWENYDDIYEEDDYSDNVFFTRLHIRYNRKNFPQDLLFQVTPNQESYQARYIVTHPATGDLSCDAGKKYLKELKERRKNEMLTLTQLTGKNYHDWNVAETKSEPLPYDVQYASINNNPAKNKNETTIIFASLGLAGLAMLFLRKKRTS